LLQEMYQCADGVIQLQFMMEKCLSLEEEIQRTKMSCTTTVQKHKNGLSYFVVGVLCQEEDIHLPLLEGFCLCLEDLTVLFTMIFIA